MGILLNLRHAQYFGNYTTNLILKLLLQNTKYSAYMKPRYDNFPFWRIISAYKLEEMYGKLHNMRSRWRFNALPSNFNHLALYLHLVNKVLASEFDEI